MRSRQPVAVRCATRLCTALVAAFACSIAPRSVAADDFYVVQSGDSLARIARKFDVTIRSLSTANGISSQSMLRPGMELTIPEKGVVFVQPGDNLTSLAEQYSTSVAALVRANRIDRPDRLRPGERLVLPGNTKARGHGSSKAKRGSATVRMLRLVNGEKLSLRLVQRDGRINSRARAQLTRLLRDRVSGHRHAPHPRLMRILSQVSRHFGGRRLVVISGYRDVRGYTKETSRHTSGRAIDFRVEGVANRVLRNYCRRFDHVGVGYYPNSNFIHLDVRRGKSYWVDWSRPGKAPRYSKPETRYASNAGKRQEQAFQAANRSGGEDEANKKALGRADGEAPADATDEATTQTQLERLQQDLVTKIRQLDASDNQPAGRNST